MLCNNKILFIYSTLFLITVFGFTFWLSPLPAQAALFNASGILGQPDYTTSTADAGQGSINAQGFNLPYSAVLDPVNNRLFVADANNRRILVFPLDTNNNATTTIAQYVLGACDFTSAGSGAASASTIGNRGFNLAYDSVNSRLFVADAAHNRVLAFNVATSTMTNCKDATFVLGQTDFTSSGATTTQSGLSNGPDDMDYDPINERLFVADEFNNRVMVFSIPGNATSSINGENAIFELGQADFISSTAATTQNGLHIPTGIAYDSVNQRVFVGDASNNRVMAFSVPSNATSSINGENALFELGQPDFISSSTATTQNGLSSSDDNTYDTTDNRLFVSDTSNNRIMIFNVPSNATSSINGMNAQNNLGQSDWVTKGANLTQSGMNGGESPHSFDPVNNILWSYDFKGYNRVVQYAMIRITAASLPAGSIGIAYSQTITTTSTQGTVSFSLYSGSLPAGLSLNTSSGVISGTPTTIGTSAFTIEADDTFATGPFFYRTAYTVSVTDTTPPSISITSPSPDASVSSIVSLSASSTDNVAVQSVQFQIDGINVGSLITSSSSPNTFTTSWNTANTANGSHTLKAISTDTSGNTASTSITVSNSGGSGNASADSFIGVNGGGTPSGSVIPSFSSATLITTTPTSSLSIITTDTIQSKISSVVVQVALLTKNSSASDIATVQAQIVSILNDIKSLQSSQSSLPTSNVIALGFHFVRPLALGMSDNEVKNLQSALKTDSSIYPEGKVTGYFGSATLKAIQRFQEKYGIASSGETGYGKVGPKTRTKLNELYGNK